MSNNASVCCTLWALDVPRIHITIWTATSIILTILMITINLYTLAALYKTQQLNTTTNKLVAAMCVSDISVGLIFFPLMIAMLQIRAANRTCRFVHLVQYAALSLGYTSFMLVIVIAIDRYLHLTKLNKYNMFMNEKKLKIIVSGAILSSHSIAGIMTYATKSFILQVVLNTTNLIGLSSVNVMYAVVIKKIKLSAKQINKKPNDEVPRVNVSEVGSTASVYGQTARRITTADIIFEGQTNEGFITVAQDDITERAKPTRLKECGLLDPETKRKRTLFTKKTKPLQRGKTKQEIAAVTTIKIILITMLCLYNPYNLFSTIFVYYRFHRNIDPDTIWKILAMWSYFILFTNGIANGIIFIYGNTRLRKFTKQLISKGKVANVEGADGITVTSLSSRRTDP
eukprot:Seg2465.4 transcript_id=Seg2465.4/GoldUCD/mRNA.D3Y31 product="Beta-1 adrenergic receptor" protein_id=Seg2465.4/GoldUCD/D3Y31